MTLVLRVPVEVNTTRTAGERTCTTTHDSDHVIASTSSNYSDVTRNIRNLEMNLYADYGV